jgi:hypothetical protein
MCIDRVIRVSIRRRWWCVGILNVHKNDAILLAAASKVGQLSRFQSWLSQWIGFGDNKLTLTSRTRSLQTKSRIAGALDLGDASAFCVRVFAYVWQGEDVLDENCPAPHPPTISPREEKGG